MLQLKITRKRLVLFVRELPMQYLIGNSKYLRFRKIPTIERFVCMNQKRGTDTIELTYEWVNQYGNVDELDEIKIELDKFASNTMYVMKGE